MRRLSIARSVQVALLGLTVALTAIAAVGVGGLYASRQDYEDELSRALRLQAGAARLLAAGVVEEATLRLAPDDASRARDAFDDTLTDLARQAAGDRRSADLVAAAGRGQERLRQRTRAPSAALAARRPLAQLAVRQGTRIATARDDAEARARRALLAIGVGGGLALLAALGLVAAIVGAVRRPLDDLVTAAGRLASGDAAARVPEETGPREIAQLAAAFNVMASDVQRAAGRVETERRRLATTVQALGDALVITDADDRVEQRNARAAALVPELAVGVPMAPPAPLAEALDHEVVVQQGDRTLAVTAAALDAGHVWTLRDVTERARLERMKSEFVATASHELRSPLTSIKGFVELLESSRGLTVRQQEWVGIVRLSTDRLVELVDDLLDVTRLEAGQVELHRRPTDVGELAREVGVLLSPRLAAKQQAFTLHVPGELPRALVDAGRLRQVLTNLLTNAHLYTDPGGRLSISARAQERTLVLEVADTGRGMTPEEAAHVFDRFYRGDDRQGPQGSGLGLAIVRSLVELHRGTIEVESERGRGSTFRVLLPRAMERPDVAGSAARTSLRGKRVLVVDDEPEVAALIAGHLEELGSTVTCVHSGPDALAALRARTYDGLTLDILMPGMTGLEVLRTLRADPALRRLPVAVVTSFSGRDALEGEWVVGKPVVHDELADALGAAVAAGRIRVLAVGAAEVRAPLDAALEALGIEHEWAADADDAAVMCARRRYEVAVVDEGLATFGEALTALELRGRRLRRAVLVFSADGVAPVGSWPDAEPVAVADAGTAVLGLLASSTVDGITTG